MCSDNFFLKHALNENIIIISYLRFCKRCLSIHRSMGSALVGANCPLTSSLSEFLGYSLYTGTGSGILGFRPCWCPSPFPSPTISVFSIHSSSHAVYFFMVAVSTPNHKPSSLFQTWDRHYGNWISENVEIPWWWSAVLPGASIPIPWWRRCATSKIGGERLFGSFGGEELKI